MDGTIARRVEASVDAAAAAAFAAATGYAALRLLPLAFVMPAAAAIAAGSFLLCRMALQRIGGDTERYHVPLFEPGAVEPLSTAPPDELLLTEADKVDPQACHEPLMLDDVLTEIAPDSRVVQLFDPAAMPTAGQLKARIDRHLDGGTPRSPSPDASEALFAALAELRRSLP
jgi:hypothetical protein